MMQEFWRGHRVMVGEQINKEGIVWGSMSDYMQTCSDPPIEDDSLYTVYIPKSQSFHERIEGRHLTLLSTDRNKGEMILQRAKRGSQGKW